MSNEELAQSLPCEEEEDEVNLLNLCHGEKTKDEIQRFHKTSWSPAFSSSGTFCVVFYSFRNCSSEKVWCFRDYSSEKVWCFRNYSSEKVWCSCDYSSEKVWYSLINVTHDLLLSFTERIYKPPPLKCRLIQTKHVLSPGACAAERPSTVGIRPV